MSRFVATSEAWRDLTWGDLATLEYGRALRGHAQRLGRYRVYGTNGPIGWHDQALCPHPGVIIGRKGAYRGVHYSPEPFFVIDTAFYVEPKAPLDLRWAYYELLTKDINGLDTGSAIPSTTREAFYALPVRVPPVQEQHAIAQALGSLDDKIELNRLMSETLEAMVRALFKSWFVDFDPVRAKAEGRDSGLPREFADLFPDSFEDSELGEIPKGWAAQSFAGMVEILGGGTPKTSVPRYWGGDIPWFSVVDAPDGSGVWVVDTEKKITQEGVKNSAAQILPVGTTIISARGTVGRIALVGVPMAMNQSCYGLRDKQGRRGFFTYFVTRELVTRLRQHAHGSVFDTITRNTLAGVSVALPTPALIDVFETCVGPSMDRLLAGQYESRALAAVRDSLLPKLIAGSLRVQRAEKIIEREP